VGNTFNDILSPLMDALEGRAGRWGAGSHKALSTGHADLDNLTGGGHPGQLWVVNGVSGVGKTTFVLGLARHAAFRQEADVQWLSTVEEPVALAEIVLSAEARVPLDHMRLARMTDDDWARLARTMGELAQAPLSFEETTPSELLAAAETLTSRRPRCLVVDALADPGDGDFLAAMRSMARAFGVWVVVVAADRPDLESHKVDGAQASVADLIIWLEREDMRDRKSPRAGEADICVTRSRFSPTSVITVAFQGHYGRLLDVTPAPGADERLW